MKSHNTYLIFFLFVFAEHAMKHRNGFVGFLVVLMVALPSALAAPRQEDAARFYEDALTRFKQDDMAAAIVQLKNVLKLEPGMLAARVLLGKAHLRQGDPVAAEEAFTKALHLGVDRSEVIVPLAQALRDQGKYKDLLEKHLPEGLPPAQKVELLVLRGQAFRALGDRNSAAAAFEEARRLDPKYLPALLAHADLLLQQGKRPDAITLVDRVLAIAPNDVAAWNFKARFAQASGDIPTALTAYSKALLFEPRSLDARIGRATLLIDLRRDQEVANDIEYFKRENPKDPRANYLRSVYLSRNGDDAGARAALQDIKQMLDPVPRQRLIQLAPGLVLVGGLAHYGLGETKQARDYFRDYLTIDPNHSGARKLLGSILLAQGKADEAINMLEVVRARTPSDPQLLALLAAAYMDRQKYRTATEYLERALQVSGDDPEIQATLGLSLLGAGQRDLALEHLRQALKEDPSQFRVGVVLAVLYLRQGLAKDAVQVAETVVRGDPKNVAALNLLGVARVAAGDRKEGRAAYLKAIESDNNFGPPQLNLARLDLIEGNYPAARDRFLAILKTRPKDTQIMYELALLEQRANNASEALRWLEKAHALNRRNTRVTSLLVELYIAQNRTEAALNAAQETEAALPDDLSALASLGEAYVAVGNLDRARTIFDRMGVIAGFDAKRQYRVAVHQMDAKNQHGAERALEKALSLDPNFLPAVVLFAEIDLRNGSVAKAEERARMVVNQNPQMAVGYRLTADVAMARKNFPEAIKGYKTALSKEPNSDGVIRLYQAYMQSGAPDKASEHLEAWVRANPKDIRVIHALAETHLRAGQLAAARSWYEQLLKLGEEGPTVYNNLANILAKQSDSNALPYAQKAHALAPNDPVIQDTLGWILVQQGQLGQGLRHLREARLRDPQSYEIRYHLAVALNRTGHADEAQTELEPVISSKAHFDGFEEAHSLWQQLSVKK
jgi:putative PEP-CTERM system TPR-repeat lipoprotein